MAHLESIQKRQKSSGAIKTCLFEIYIGYHIHIYEDQLQIKAHQVHIWCHLAEDSFLSGCMQLYNKGHRGQTKQ